MQSNLERPQSFELSVLAEGVRVTRVYVLWLTKNFLEKKKNLTVSDRSMRRYYDISVMRGPILLKLDLFESLYAVYIRKMPLNLDNIAGVMSY